MKRFDFSWLVKSQTSDTGTYISELYDTGFTQGCDGGVGSFRLYEQLTKRHLLAPEQRPHLVLLSATTTSKLLLSLYLNVQ